MTEKEQAQAAYTPSFVRLGRHVWFTLESSRRADPDRASSLEEILGHTGADRQEVASMGISWMHMGDWSNRRYWNDQEWVAFLRTWKPYGGQVFMGNDVSEEEKELFNAFLVYWTFYACLPTRPEGAPESISMEDAGDRVDMLLANFQDRLGDTLAPCHVCRKNALGHRLLRCTRCKLAYYCSRECQILGWRRGHKRECAQTEE
jgi:hypothetical protein